MGKYKHGKPDEEISLADLEEKLSKCNFSTREKAYVILLYWLGCRRSEPMVIKKEDIEANIVKNVRVMVLPYLKNNGNSIAGKFKTKGEILIYPRKMSFLQKLIQTYENEKTHLYIKYRAIATLMHELLHLKYLNDEENVRKLTKMYFNLFTESQDVNKQAIHKMLF